MRLHDLLENKFRTSLPDINISGVTDNTKEIEKDILFFCVKGKTFDGHDFAKEAIEKGAAAVVTERDLEIENQIIVDDTRKAYGEICASWYNHPERKLKLIGVTGTNGKTTMTSLIKEVLTKSGHRVGLIGTIRNEIMGEVFETDKTSPLTKDYMELLSRMVKAGCDCAVMEVSSFALEQQRIGPSHFRIGVFTNLTQDHLDYHGDMEEYYKAKKLLFSRCDTAIINTDDEYGKRLYSEITCDKRSCSLEEEADYTAENIEISQDKLSYDLIGKENNISVSLGMTGKFNIMNSLQAAAACLEMRIPEEKVSSALSTVSGVKGRCEIIPTGKDYTVICDYAHSPDGIKNILSSLKPFAENRLVCLFGCGGDRDKTKRPLMAKAAAEYADKLIITSDNPRNEEPSAIIEDILEGLKDSSVSYDVVENRRDAIKHALVTGEKGDIIVLAGKGHEDYQILKGYEKIHFDEREIVAEILKEI